MSCRPRTHVIIFPFIILLAGCAHTLSPLFEDYRIDRSQAPIDSIHTAIERAVVDAGWTLDDPPAPNVVSTDELSVAEWGLYKVVVSLDVVPIDGTYVRVYVHPYRVYLWGSRSKMPYMSRRVRNFVFPDLSETLAKNGIVGLDVSLAADTTE